MKNDSDTGSLIVGIDGLALDEDWRALLRHPAVGGVILFARNFDSVEQVRALTTEIRALRSPRLLVTVDQEGGRVRRFRSSELTPLPPPGLLGRWFASHPDRGRDLAYRHGRIMAAEMLALNVDLSWAPVLDLDRGSSVIGDRAMAADPAAVSELGAYYIAGMKDAGMAACAKHFPGHGSVEADSHHCVVTDPRPAEALEDDLQPFANLADRLAAVMMAHVCYPAIDPQPAGFSRRWIAQELRGRLGFGGLVVSDDLDMAGASPGGDLRQRLEQAFAAGCELALVCNPASARSLLADALPALPRLSGNRLATLYGRPMMTMSEQMLVPEFRAWRDSLKELNGQDQ